MEKKNAYIKVELSEDGSVSIDTNLSALGAMHMMSNATQIIIEQHINTPEEEEKDVQ
jgi:hypothetical protein